MTTPGRRHFALRLALFWIAIWEPLVPGSCRLTWRDQWRADLWHYSLWLSRQPVSSVAAAARLFARATAALPHALLLRVSAWSLHMLMHDVRFAWRQVVRRPAFTAVAVLILGLGIGANATIFSWAETVLLSPMPGVSEQHRLVSLRGTTPNRNDLSFSYLNYADLRAARPAGFEDLTAFRGQAMSLRADGEPIRVWGELVTANFFDVLRITPALGRTFLPADDAGPGKEPVAVISYALWQGMLNAFLPPSPIPIGFSAGVSPMVVAFSVLVTCIAAALVGLVPAIRASRPDVAWTLKDAAASTTPGSRRSRLRQALVVSQVALSLVLLACAAFFGRSLQHAQLMDPGYSTRRGVIASLDLLSNGYDEARGLVFYQELLRRLASVPEVQAASVTSALPLDPGPSSDMAVQLDGYQAKEGEEVTAYYSRVGAGYFDALGVPIVAGRAIDDRDIAGQELSVVINETMARRYFQGREAVGSTLRYGRGPARVVGVAKDGKYGRLNEAPRNFMYVPIMQFYRPDVGLVVRTGGDPGRVIGAIRAEMARLDPNMPLFDVRTVEEHMRFGVFIPTLAGTMLGAFGALALFLATVGLYSVIAFSVAQRTHEIGVRMALGAGRADVLRMVLRQGVVLTVLGLLIGAALTAGVTRLVADQLIGVSPSDPASWATTLTLLAIVSLTACGFPAFRAASQDPLRALRRD